MTSSSELIEVEEGDFMEHKQEPPPQEQQELARQARIINSGDSLIWNVELGLGQGANFDSYSFFTVAAAQNFLREQGFTALGEVCVTSAGVQIQLWSKENEKEIRVMRGEEELYDADAGEMSERAMDATRCERCGDEEIEWRVTTPSGNQILVGSNCNDALPSEYDREAVEFEDDLP
jgi:hypothetical protein